MRQSFSGAVMPAARFSRTDAAGRADAFVLFAGDQRRSFAADRDPNKLASLRQCSGSEQTRFAQTVFGIRRPALLISRLITAAHAENAPARPAASRTKACTQKQKNKAA